MIPDWIAAIIFIVFMLIVIVGCLSLPEPMSGGHSIRRGTVEEYWEDDEG